MGMAITLEAPARPRIRAPFELQTGGGALAVRNSFYEGGAHTNRTSRWQAPTVSPNQGVLANLATLRDRSRRAVRNDGIAKSAIDKLVTNIVGTGIKPLSQAPDPQFRKDVQALFARWTDESDADGLLDFYGQQSQVCRTWLEAGDAFGRLRLRLPADGLSVPLQVQVLEPELVPHEYDRSFGTGNKIRAAIEFSPIGKRVAYHVYAQRPGDAQDFDPMDLRRIPADAIVHIYDPLRAGQLRGIPILTQALIRLYELDKFDDATLLRQQLANMFVGFIRKPASASETAVNPFTGAELDTTDEKPMLSLEPGLFQELDPGEEVDFSKPPDAGQNYPSFMKQQLFGVAAATGVPYEVLTGDMSGVNDRTVRVILHEFRRRIMQAQHQILVFQFCRPIWKAWLLRAYLAGVLDMPGYLENPEPYERVKWMPQGWPYLQPVQDIEAKVAAVRSGLSSRAAEVSETGEDVEAIDAEQASDNARADALGLKYDSDGRQPKNGATAAPVGMSVSQALRSGRSTAGRWVDPGPEPLKLYDEYGRLMRMFDQGAGATA